MAQDDWEDGHADAVRMVDVVAALVVGALAVGWIDDRCWWRASKEGPAREEASLARLLLESAAAGLRHTMRKPRGGTGCNEAEVEQEGGGRCWYSFECSSTSSSATRGRRLVVDSFEKEG